VVIPPGMTRGRPAGRPTSRPMFAPASAADQPPAGASSAAIVRQGSRKRQQVPIAPASVFGPIGRRRFWWYTYRCRPCGAYLFGRARSLDAVAGERRAACGHREQIMAARIYTQPESGAAA
jgi:hypothetical protein